MIGNRNWHPMFDQTVTELVDGGHRQVLALATSAYQSYSSCRQYCEDLVKAADGTQLRIDKLDPFWSAEGFVAANARALVDAVRELRASIGEAELRVLFTRRGAPLLIDFGTRMRGYNSDLTRTFHFGKVTARYEGVYRTVLDAQRAALQAIRPGVRAGDVDRAARDVIAAAGYAACFGHGLGHGIGLEVHEEPRLGPGVATKLEAGMVFTVEPGIYLPGWGGVRIEDMAAVTSTGCVVLTGSARELGDSVL